MCRSLVALLTAAVGMAACTVQENAHHSAGEMELVVLGPVDGYNLSGTDLDRVQVGMMAPDFSLVSLTGPPITLSEFRGVKNVALVFYRGYW